MEATTQVLMNTLEYDNTLKLGSLRILFLLYEADLHNFQKSFLKHRYTKNSFLKTALRFMQTAYNSNVNILNTRCQRLSLTIAYVSAAFLHLSVRKLATRGRPNSELRDGPLCPPVQTALSGS